MLATNSLTEVPAFAPWAKVSPQMGTAAVIADVPWLYSALTQVREIEEEGESVPGLGDLRVAVQTAMSARKLLSSIEIERLPAPTVAPVSGGGLSVTWYLGQKEVKLSFSPGGEAMYYKAIDDEIVDDGAVEAEEPSHVAGQLKWILESAA
jgi:hypothetical protein